MCEWVAGGQRGLFQQFDTITAPLPPPNNAQQCCSTLRLQPTHSKDITRRPAPQRSHIYTHSTLGGVYYNQRTPDGADMKCYFRGSFLHRCFLQLPRGFLICVLPAFLLSVKCRTEGGRPRVSGAITVGYSQSDNEHPAPPSSPAQRAARCGRISTREQK